MIQKSKINIDDDLHFNNFNQILCLYDFIDFIFNF